MEDDSGEQRVDESHEAIDVVGTFTIAPRDREVNNQSALVCTKSPTMADD